MIKLKYVVIYPESKDCGEKRIHGVINLENDSIPREAVCDMLFAGFGNHPDPEVLLPEWKKARTRSMSVGDLINFENSDLYYICDTCGWFSVDTLKAYLWMDHPRKYSFDMFELRKWKKENGIDHNTLS